MKPVRIAIVAGEASGDLLAAHLVTALRNHLPAVEFIGIAGPKMISAGVKPLFPLEKLSVRGYVEAIRQLPEILRIRRHLKQQLIQRKPDLYIGVDAPDFNLGVERYLRKRGIKTVHLASPSIWAWRARRIHKIKASVDHMLLLFPFEQDIYDKAGIPATYVGHPLADMFPMTTPTQPMREQLKLPLHAPIVAMLPGSRQGELQQHADLFLQTAKRLLELQPEMRFLVPLATQETRNIFEAARYRNQAQNLPITILFGHAQKAMSAADCVLVASGTATLEAALLKRPMVITYRVPKLTYWLMWPRRYLPYIGLPNILAGRFIIPEVLQENATPDNLAQAIFNWITDNAARKELQDEFMRMHESLKMNMAERSSETILSLLGLAPAHSAPASAC